MNEPYKRIAKIEYVYYRTSGVCVDFYDTNGIQYGRGRHYRGITLSSLNRLLRSINRFCNIKIVAEGYMPVIVAYPKDSN